MKKTPLFQRIVQIGIVLFATLFVAQATVPSKVFAQQDVINTAADRLEEKTGETESGGGIYNPVVNSAIGSSRSDAKSGASLNTLIGMILRFIMMFAALLVLIELINAAYNWIGSAGDKGKLEKARGQITHAVIGLILLAGSVAVLDIVLGFLDVTLNFTQLFQGN